MISSIADVISGKENVKRWLEPSGEKAIQLLTAIHFSRRTYIPSAIVYNNGAIRQLPDDIAVETPVIADADGIHKVMIPELPDGIIGLLNNQVSAQRLSVRAGALGACERAKMILQENFPV